MEILKGRFLGKDYFGQNQVFQFGFVLFVFWFCSVCILVLFCLYFGFVLFVFWFCFVCFALNCVLYLILFSIIYFFFHFFNFCIIVEFLIVSSLFISKWLRNVVTFFKR